MSTTESRPYISGFERRAAERGLQEGILVRSREDLLAVITARFGPVEDPVREKIDGLDNAGRLSALLVKAASAGSFEEFRPELDR